MGARKRISANGALWIVAVALTAGSAGAVSDWQFRSVLAGEVAKTLMFPPVGPKEIAEQAEMWRGSGVEGFFFHCGDWSEDLNDPGKAEVRDAVVRAVRALKAAGISHNFVKTSYASLAPDWFDDAAWAKRAAVLASLARLGREAGCQGVAQDVEYLGDQYRLTWPGYRGMDKAKLRKAVRERGRQVVAAILEAFPGAELMVLPDGISNMPVLCREYSAGMIEAAARHGAAAFFFMPEYTYTSPSPLWQIGYCHFVDQAALRRIEPSAREWWRKHGGVAPGYWPMAIGRGGEADYAFMSPEWFRTGLAAQRMVAQRYTWVYAPSRLWLDFSPEVKVRYGSVVALEGPREWPVADFRKVLAGHEVIADPYVAEVAQRVRERRPVSMGTIQQWQVLGPFAWSEGEDLAADEPPAFDPTATYPGRARPVRWRLMRPMYELAGEVLLNRQLAEGEWIYCYARCWVFSPREQRAELHLGSDDDIAAWYDGELAWQQVAQRECGVDDDIVPITLKPGWRPLALKVRNQVGGWGFTARFTSSDGRPLRDITTSPTPPSD